MILPYLLRLLCLSLTCFFLVHLAIGVAVALTAPMAIRLAGRAKASVAARILLGVRLLPAVMALTVVGGLCVPSYLWFEPEMAAELVSPVCLLVGLLGAGILAASIGRAVRVVRRSARFIRECRDASRETRLRGEQVSVWVLQDPAPFLALAGVIHPRVIISRAVLRALSPPQLAAALRHERAHRTSRDNLKRLLILAAPGLLPFHRGFGAIEKEWEKFTEWAADDRAVAGSYRRSLSLAGALVRVARLGGCGQSSPLLASFLANSQDLPARVERLLGTTPLDVEEGFSPRMTGAGLVLGCAALGILLQPATLHFVHRILERLVD